MCSTQACQLSGPLAGKTILARRRDYGSWHGANLKKLMTKRDLTPFELAQSLHQQVALTCLRGEYFQDWPDVATLLDQHILKREKVMSKQGHTCAIDLLAWKKHRAWEDAPGKFFLLQQVRHDQRQREEKTPTGQGRGSAASSCLSRWGCLGGSGCKKCRARAPCGDGAGAARAARVRFRTLCFGRTSRGFPGRSGLGRVPCCSGRACSAVASPTAGVGQAWSRQLAFLRTVRTSTTRRTNKLLVLAASPGRTALQR